jgi:hypothetical protein
MTLRYLLRAITKPSCFNERRKATWRHFISYI